MKTTISIGSLCAVLGLVACSDAVAAPDNTVAFGLYAVFYHTSATDVSGPFVPPGVTADTSNVQTEYFAYFRRLTTHLDLELAGGVPPKTNTVGKGPATLGSVPWNGQVVGSVKWLAPSLLLRYKFFDESAALRPYVGVGVNYTHFYDREINAAGDAALGGPTSISLKNSIGPAATVGVYYRVWGNWSAIASFSASQVETKLTAYTAGVTRTSTVSFNPQALVFAVGYSF
jgi:outer membrane protein